MHTYTASPATKDRSLPNTPSTADITRAPVDQALTSPYPEIGPHCKTSGPSKIGVPANYEIPLEGDAEPSAQLDHQGVLD